MGSKVLVFGMVAAMLACAPPKGMQPTPEKAPAAWSRPGTASTASESSWWQALADPELELLVATALQRHSRLEEAAAVLDRVRAEHAGAAAHGRPQLHAAGGLQRERHGLQRLRDADGSVVTTPPQLRNSAQASLALTHEVDLLGRNRLNLQRAEQDIRARACDLKHLQQLTAFETVDAYLAYRQAEARGQLAARIESEAKAVVVSLSARQAAGLETEEGVRAARMQVTSWGQVVAQARCEREQAKARLGLLTAQAPTAVVLEPRHPESAGEVPPLVLDEPRVVLQRRQDIQAAWHRLESATLEADRVRLERFPTFTIQAQVGYAGDTLRRWLSGDGLGWLLQSVLQGPLLDGGRNRARSAAARAMACEQEAAYRAAVYQGVFEVERSLAALDQALDHRAGLAATLEERRRDGASVIRRLESGRADRRDFLEANLQASGASLANQMARWDALRVWADCQRALGR